MTLPLNKTELQFLTDHHQAAMITLRACSVCKMTSSEPTIVRRAPVLTVPQGQISRSSSRRSLGGIGR